MQQIPGVTVIIYDQECAAEKRRKRSRGQLAEPTMRLVINEEVCEGCGDCVQQANCMSLTPVQTELGQKIRIHQSSCNKDYTCALGDCPSFVTVQIKAGTGLKKKSLPKLPPADVPAPRQVVKAGDGYRIIGPGIGGTGVVTINALLATAAWIDGLSVATLDQTGTAQKGGAVVSHLLLSEHPIEAPAKVNAGNADLILGFDLLGVVHPGNLKYRLRRTNGRHRQQRLIPTIDNIRNRAPVSRTRSDAGAGELGDQSRPQHFPGCQSAGRRIVRHSHGRESFHDGSGVSGRADSDLARSHRAGHRVERRGYRAQPADCFPGAASITKTPPLWNRAPPGKRERKEAALFDRVAELREYQNESYARTYSDFLETIPEPSLKETVARYLYKLMAYKDEYEVARLVNQA